MRLIAILLAVGFVAATGPSLDAQELLIQYTFDEESGPALDSGIGDPANGTLGATATRIADTPGMASPFALDLSAEGLESFVNAGDVDKVDILDAFTLTTWLKLDGLNNENGGSGNVRLIAKQAGGAFNGISWNLNGPNEGDRGIDNFRTGLFIGGDDSFAFAFSEEDVSAEDWAFLAVSYDSEFGDTAFYFGNETVETVQLGELLEIAAGPVASTEGEANFGVGFTDAAPATDFSVVGFQDDVRVYGGVLSLEQLEAVRLENLVGDLPCNPDSGGDLDGNGTVEFADFLVLSANFGSMTTTHEDGDIDCNGTVEFADFLELSANFGNTVGGATSVPEPGGQFLLSLAGFGLAMAVRRKRQ